MCAGKEGAEFQFIQEKMKHLSKKPYDELHNAPSPEADQPHKSCTMGHTHPIFFSRQAVVMKAEAAQYRIEKLIKELEVGREETSSSECQECRQKVHQAAKDQFVSHKVELLSEEPFMKELEKHLTQKDSITLLGEVIRNCVPPAASSEEVWAAMKRRMEEIAREQKKKLH